MQDVTTAGASSRGSSLRQASVRMLHGQHGGSLQFHMQGRAGVLASGGASSSTLNGSGNVNGTTSVAMFGALLGKDPASSGTPTPGQTWGVAPGQMRKPVSRRHSTVTFVDQLVSGSMDELATLESSLDIQKHGSRQSQTDLKPNRDGDHED